MGVTRRNLIGSISSIGAVALAGCTFSGPDVDAKDAAESEGSLYKDSDAFNQITYTGGRILISLEEFPYVVGDETPVERVALSTERGELIDSKAFIYGKLRYTFERPSDADFFRATVSYTSNGEDSRRRNAIESIRFEVSDGEVRTLQLKEVDGNE